MFNKIKNIFDIEKKSVFLVNFFLIITIILFFIFDVSIELFFYFNFILTFTLAYFFFKKSKALAKTLIVTNMFIFFYFLYPIVATFLGGIFGAQSYIFILFYTIVLSYIFLYVSGNHKTFLGNTKKFNSKIIASTFLVGITFGVLFFYVGEPVPSQFTQVSDSFFKFSIFIIFSSFILALGEQMIFSGFLFNSYRKLTSKKDAFFQVSLIFVCFHLLRFEVLVNYYIVQFSGAYLLAIISYYILLFIFMYVALYLYSFKSKKQEGIFLYPVILHFGADLTLFLFTTLSLIA